MKSPKTRLEISLRRTVRALIQTRSNWRKEYRQQRKNWFLESVSDDLQHKLMARGFLILVMVVMGTLAASKPELLVRITAGVSAIALIIGWGFAHTTIHSLSRSHFLAIQSVLPICDSEIAAMQLRSVTTKTFSMLLGWVAYPVTLSIAGELPPIFVLISLGLGVLFWLTTISLTMVILSFLPQLTRPQALPVFMLAIVIGGSAVAFAVSRNWITFDGFCVIANSVMPAGWALSVQLNMMQAEPVPLFELLLIPTVLLIVIGFVFRSRFTESYSITSLEIQGDGTMQATDAGQLTISLIEPEEDLPELEPRFARELVSQELREFRYEFEQSNWIENKVWTMLNPEEQNAMLVISPEVPGWTTQFKYMSIVVAGALAGTFVFSFFTGVEEIVTMAFGSLALAFVFMISAVPTVIWRSSNVESCSSIMLMPVSDNHLNRIAMILGTIRAIGMFPFCYVAGLIISWTQGGEFSVLQSLLFGAKGSLIFLASHQWWFKLVQPYDVGKQNVQHGLELLLAVATAGGCVLLFIDPSSQVFTLIGTCLVFGSGHLAYKSFRFRKLRRPLDFIHGALDEDGVPT